MPTRKSASQSIDQMEIHITEMSQAENDYGEGLQHLSSTISAKLDEGAQNTEWFSSACIHRVPKDLRMVNRKAYTSRLIAVGPLHRNDKHLQTPLQHVKVIYTNNLLCRLTGGLGGQESVEKKNAVLQECLAEIKKSIKDAKKCYLAEVKLDEEMMLVDGCFILELLYISFHGTSMGQDPIFGNSLIRYTVERDLISLENQIPFFVLEKLFLLTLARIPNDLNKNLLLTDYVLEYFGKMLILADGCLLPLLRGPPDDHEPSTGDSSSWKTCFDYVLRILHNKSENSTTAADQENVESGTSTTDHHPRNPQYYHILHMLHDGFLPRNYQLKKKKRPSHSHSSKQKRKKQITPSELGVMSSASELAYAGVKFVAGTGNDLFEVKFTEPEGLLRWFRSAHFEIPPIYLFDYTESFLRNLIAFEQCCHGISKHVSSYAYVMDVLVNSEKDVQVLEKARVLNNYLGARKGATDLFNKLGILAFTGDHFGDTLDEATMYSRRFWPKHMAHLRRTYFESPWTFIAFFVGFIAFAITLVQFIRDFLKKG